MFGIKKNTMKDVMVFFNNEVNVDDLVSDLHDITEIIWHFGGAKKGNLIDSIGNHWVNDAHYKVVSLYIDRTNLKELEDKFHNNGFKAVRFLQVTM